MTDSIIDIYFWLMIGAIFALYFLGYKPYHIDRTRQAIFKIRDELFMHAVEKNIPFDADAYVMMRHLCNKYIDFSHDITLTRVVCTHRILARAGVNTAFSVKFAAALKHLPLEQRQVVDQALGDLHYVMINHLFRGSLPGIYMIESLKVAIFARQTANALTIARKNFQRRFKLRISSLDAAAIA